MAIKDIATRIISRKLFAVIRLKRETDVVRVAKRIHEAGIENIEITLNTPGALSAINELAREKGILIGAGTVIGYDNTVQAIESGAKFVVSPVTDLDMISVAKEVGVVSIAGALTPTEAWQAHQAGADFVKVFPLAALGPDYIRALRGPLPEIPYVVTNGVTLENIPDFLAAGAVAIGLGSVLVTDTDLDNLDVVAERAARALMAVR